jgi:hypothetical protein
MPILPVLLLPALLSLQEKGEGPDPAVALRKHWKPITLSRDTTSAREILEEILRDSDEKFELPDDWQPKPISVKFDGATFWQAVDEVCRLDGALGLSLDRGRFSLVKKPARPTSIAYAGPLRFSVHDVTRVRELKDAERRDRTELTLRVHWTKGYRPILDPWPQPGSIEVLRAEDIRGRSLLPPVDVEATFVRSASGTSERSSVWLLRLQPVDRDLNSIARLDVLWKTPFPEELEDVVFDTPTQSEGVCHRVGDFRVTLESCKRDPKGGSSLQVIVVLEADPSNLSPAVRRELDAVPLARRLLQEVELDGKTQDRQYFTAKPDPKNPLRVALSTWVSGLGEPQSLKVRVARRMSLLSVPLSFKDVRLPEAVK